MISEEPMFEVKLSTEEFEELICNKVYEYRLPLNRENRRLLPEISFRIGEETCVVLDGPKRVCFREKRSKSRIIRWIRLTYIVVDPIDKVKYIELRLI